MTQDSEDDSKVQSLTGLLANGDLIIGDGDFDQAVHLFAQLVSTTITVHPILLEVQRDLQQQSDLLYARRLQLIFKKDQINRDREYAEAEQRLEQRNFEKILKDIGMTDLIRRIMAGEK